MSAIQGPSRDGVFKMFDRIAGRYDFLNRVLSFGMDIRWRKRVRRHLPNKPQIRLLDVATGTADLLIELSNDERVTMGNGVDPSRGMLDIGETKLHKGRDGVDLALHLGDAHDLSDYYDQYDAVTIAFGIRNVERPVEGMTEMYKCLSPGGRLVVLEFSEPEGPLFGPFYRVYRKHLLPQIGGVISGDKEAYTYLDETITTFPCGERFLDLMRSAGFEDCKIDAMMLGAVSIYVGTKSE